MIISSHFPVCTGHCYLNVYMNFYDAFGLLFKIHNLEIHKIQWMYSKVKNEVKDYWKKISGKTKAHSQISTSKQKLLGLSKCNPLPSLLEDMRGRMVLLTSGMLSAHSCKRSWPSPTMEHIL